MDKAMTLNKKIEEALADTFCIQGQLNRESIATFVIAIILEEAAKVADIETGDCVRCAGTGDAIRALGEDKP